MRDYKWEDFNERMKEDYRKLWPGISDEEIIKQINTPILSKHEAIELRKSLSKDEVEFECPKCGSKDYGIYVDENFMKLQYCKGPLIDGKYAGCSYETKYNKFEEMSRKGLKSLKSDTSIIENAVKINEKVCCDSYEEGMEEIIGQNIFCYNQTVAPKYTSGAFKFCPWCGAKLNGK